VLISGNMYTGWESICDYMHVVVSVGVYLLSFSIPSHFTEGSCVLETVLSGGYCCNWVCDFFYLFIYEWGNEIRRRKGGKERSWGRGMKTRKKWSFPRDWTWTWAEMWGPDERRLWESFEVYPGKLRSPSLRDVWVPYWLTRFKGIPTPVVYKPPY
jgi:hypothetical protein